MRRVAAALLALAAATSAGCVRVRVHERETLAHPALAQPAWPDHHDAHAHVYEIREGTGGAVGAGGGGCGCN